MTRLATVAVLVIAAFAPLGIKQSSGASARPAGRSRATALDQARSSLPLPRASSSSSVDVGRRRPPTERADRSRRRQAPQGDGTWTALAACESGGDPRARSAGGQYFGAFQFSLATWRSLGLEGNPTNHSYETQLAAARRLQARSGWGQWPRCSRRLGLR